MRYNGYKVYVKIGFLASDLESLSESLKVTDV
jgi:hypothetical protein